MAEANAGTAGRLARMGMPLITPSHGLAALASIMSNHAATSCIAAVPFHWDKFLQQGGNRQQPIFAEFAAHHTSHPPAATVQPQLQSMSTSHVAAATLPTVAEQAQAVAAAVESTISSVLGSGVSKSAPLMAAGLDSLGMVELRNALQTKLGLLLPSTLVFDYPTAEDITAYITAQMPVDQATDVEQSHVAAPHNTFQSEHQQQQQQLVQNGAVLDATAIIQEVVANVMGSTPLGDAPLMAAGLDSLGMVEVRNALEARLGLQLPTTLVFDYPTVDAISAFVTPQLTTPASELTASVRSMVAVPQQQQKHASAQTFAVTAMITTAPQDALDTTAAKDTVTAVPLSRWDVNEPPEGLFTGPAVRFGSYLSQPAAFDAAAFNTSDTEAVLMDPQQRLLLQSAAEALGCSHLLGNRSAVTKPGTHVGFFVGVSSCDYAMLVRQHSQGVTAYTATGRAASVTSGRLSYTFGLKGPSLTVDTACSSSLVSLHMAFSSLLLGQCSAACNSGVNIMTSSETPAAFQKAGMLSADGRCKTLDSTADGYVRAEACGSMVLQSAGLVGSSDVVAVVRGSAVNQDGRSSSLTAPNGPSQQAVIRQALQAAALEPHHVHALQLHGTGGDVALSHAWLAYPFADNAK